jgi:hypothetical protein
MGPLLKMVTFVAAKESSDRETCVEFMNQFNDSCGDAETQGAGWKSARRRRRPLHDLGILCPNRACL